MLKELKRRGIQVPSDIALTGFDGIQHSLFPRPAITTVCQHVFEIGRTAVRNLIDYDPKKKNLVFDTELIIGTSCGCNRDSTAKRKNQKAYNETLDYKNDLEYYFDDVLTAIENMKFIKDIKELDIWFVRNLPVLGIESANIFIYRDSPSFSPFVKFLAGYDKKGRKHDDVEKVLPLQALFDIILPVNERRSYCILPLLYHEQQYGLLVMEVFMQSANSYDSLATHISNFIWNSMLVEEVRKTNGMLRQAYKQKTQFFINVAHETKTPLTLIKNYLDRSMRHHSSDPDLAVVKRNVDTLLENMLNLLDAERLEKGSMSFSHESFIDLSKTTQQKCMLFKVVAEKKDTTINLKIEKDIFIKIDPWAIDRVLNNLLDNAIRYTQDGGKVTVDVKKTGKKAVLCIIDNGPGISADILSHLFDPYYQLSRKRSGKQGIGVGLSIVKNIIDDLGASITVVNNKNGGVCSTCVFQEHSSLVVKKNLKTIPLSQVPAGIEFDKHIEEEDISSDKSSIFIVDDNIQMLNFLKMSLKNKYNVFLATNVPEALAKIKTIVRPELIISDIMMDDMDGHALLETITETEELYDIPFIFLTAVSTQDEEIRGLAEGAIDYIKKPFSLPELENKIESIINLRKRMKKRDIMDIRKGLEDLLSKITDSKKQQPGAVFESLCIKYSFTPREKEIIKLLLEGFIIKEIANRLHLSRRSIEYHITNIYKKTGVKNRYNLLSLFKI